jgi:hypothetical protein
MKQLITPVFLLTVLAAFFAACTNTSRLIATGLEIDLTAIESASDGSATAEWHVKNPNVVPYLFSHVTHKIFLNGTAVGVIDESEPLAIPSASTADRTSKLSGVDAAAKRALAAAVSAGSANYRVDSLITISIYDDSAEKSVLTHSGTVPVKAK